MAGRKNAEIAVDDFHRDLDAEMEALDAKRLRVKAGGTWRTVRAPRDMSIVDQEILRVLMEEQQDIASDKSLSRQERRTRLSDVEDGFIEVALGVDAVPDDLSPEHRAEIVRAFTAGLREHERDNPDWLLPLSQQVVLQAYRKTQQEAAEKIRELGRNRRAQPDGNDSPKNESEDEKSATTSSSPIAAD